MMYKPSAKMLAFSLSRLGQKGVLGVQESTMKALALWAREQHQATYIFHVIQDTFIYKAMCLLCIPHTQ
jgi:hypothetical protein